MQYIACGTVVNLAKYRISQYAIWCFTKYSQGESNRARIRAEVARKDFCAPHHTKVKHLFTFVLTLGVVCIIFRVVKQSKCSMNKDVVWTGAFLKETMKRVGATQQSVADAIGVFQPYVIRMKKCSYFRAKTIAKLDKWLDSLPDKPLDKDAKK
jgi:hypothetical protein